MACAEHMSFQMSGKSRLWLLGHSHDPKGLSPRQNG